MTKRIARHIVLFILLVGLSLFANSAPAIVEAEANASCTAASDGDPTDVICIDEAGRVGIGTATPTHHFTVNGGEMIVNDGAGANLQFGFVSDVARIRIGGAGAANNGIRIQGPGERGEALLRIWGNGKTAFGALTEPQTGIKLQVAGGGIQAESLLVAAQPGKGVEVKGAGNQFVSIATTDSEASAMVLTAVSSNDRTESQIQYKGRFSLVSPLAGEARFVVDESGYVGIGTKSPNTALHVNGTTTTEVLQITGGADLAEPFAVNDTSDAIEPGTVVILDADQPGELRVAQRAYDPLVAGVISGAGDIQPGLIMQQENSAMVQGEVHPVALTGKVYVKAVGPIEVGDLLTTSDVAGHAMTATDRAKAFSATLGKAMSPLEKGEKGLVLILVALQ